MCVCAMDSWWLLQLYPLLSRDFTKSGYLHKTPPNKLVCSLTNAALPTHSNWPYGFWFTEVSETVLPAGPEQTHIPGETYGQ